MGSDAGLERLELEDMLFYAIAEMMLDGLPGLLTRVEVLTLAEAMAKELIEDGWRTNFNPNVK